ncbi:hypothetical protein GTY41_41480 [Streptomyces sp. SID685]|uniref:condensation domain-containing protein n=1 Tax=Streptomyces TaxID=1883 RepID=UPI001370DA93|nr:hypothetical protein [Streptomyces sp. SID685]
MIPLSYAQSRMWFLDRLGEGASYLLPLAYRLRGSLDRAALAAALGEVTGRHEALRTVFPETDGVPRQVVLEPATSRPDLAVVHLDEDRLPAALAAAAERPFDLTGEAPLRTTLFDLGGDTHVLLILLHHIAADGWSQEVLLRDLATAYAARRRGCPPDWPPLPIQYVDYTLWQQSLLADEDDPASVAGAHLAYWRDRLDGMPEHLELPTDRARPATVSQHGATATATVPADVHRGVLALATAERATPFMVVQAALAVLLTMVSPAEDIPIGTIVAGRTEEALADVIGVCVNTLVLRTDTSGTPSFRALLRRVRATDLEAFAYQELPFERLVDVLRPARSTAWSPLFQVLLVREDDRTLVPELAGLRATEEPVASNRSKFDLSLYFRELQAADGGPGGVGCALEYATDLFDAATADNILRWLGRILAQVVADPNLRISDVDILTPGERHELLTEFNSRFEYAHVRDGRSTTSRNGRDG